MKCIEPATGIVLFSLFTLLVEASTFQTIMGSFKSAKICGCQEVTASSSAVYHFLRRPNYLQQNGNHLLITDRVFSSTYSILTTKATKRPDDILVTIILTRPHFPSRSLWCLSGWSQRHVYCLWKQNYVYAETLQSFVSFSRMLNDVNVHN